MQTETSNRQAKMNEKQNIDLKSKEKIFTVDRLNVAGTKRSDKTISGIHDLEGRDAKDVKGKRPRTINNSLPIVNYRRDIVDSVRQFLTTVVIGETGSGKSTQIPQYLIDSNICKRVVCTQPRRVAAVTVAQRVAEERGCNLSEEVGYSIRFEDKTSFSTKIKYVTDGVLLREFMTDSKLSKYDVVILDEAHERSLQTDILMGMLRSLQDQRKDLKVIVMSATLQIDLFMKFFKDTNLVSIPGRQYPVDVYYLDEPEPDFVDAAMLACLQIHGNEESGDVLVFLPGQDEIEGLANLLEQNLPKVPISSKVIRDATQLRSGISDDFVVLPLYASLSSEDQYKVFQPSPAHIRKFILATNIAETSVTITGVKFVVDTGFVKSRLLQSSTSIEMLKITTVSQSQANQRAGRAGRESAGKCFRLYTESAFEQLPETSLPEIQRVNISQVILQLKVYGVKNLEDFQFVTKPSSGSLRNALEELFLVEALDKKQELTTLGKKISRLPLDPILANLLLKSQDYKCVSEILIAVSMLSSDNIFIHPSKESEKLQAHQAHRRFHSPDGDLLTLVTIFQAWMRANREISWCRSNFISYRSMSHAYHVKEQLEKLLSVQEVNHEQGKGNKAFDFGVNVKLTSMPSKEPFLKCLAAGLCLQIAKKSSTVAYNGSNAKMQQRNASFGKFSKILAIADDRAPYKTLRGGQSVHIHPSSTLFSSKSLPEYVTYGELLTTSKQYMRNVTAIDKSWLPEVAGHVIKGIYYDEKRKSTV